MNHASYGAYRQASLNVQLCGASPVQLALALLNALLDEMVRVRSHVENGRYEAKGNGISKCIDMLAVLSSALDIDAGGEPVARLARLYDYCTVRLNEAGCMLDTAMVEEVIGLVTVLRDAWQEVEGRSA